MSDAYQLTGEQVTAVALMNLQVNQLRAAAFELKHEALKQGDAAAALEYAANVLEDRKQSWLRETQQRVKLASPAIPSKLITAH